MQIPSRFGQRFGNYRLTRLLGKGGHSEVYLAENVEVPNLQYAIKIFTNVNLAGHQQDEFREEASIVIKLHLHNAHIVHVIDVGVQESKNKREESGTPYIMMEYASAGTLRSRHSRGIPVPFERIVLYVNQIADALQCAHDNQVMHLDVKPENILLHNPDFLVLSDFGISITGQSGELKPQNTVAGTALYMAPERLTSYPQRASDQYSLGVIVYEWLCGEPPFTGKDAEEICSKHIASMPPPLRTRNPHITQAIEDVVMRALKKEPKERYGDVKKFASALEQAIQAALEQEQHLSSPATIIEEVGITDAFHQTLHASFEQHEPAVASINQAPESLFAPSSKQPPVEQVPQVPALFRPLSQPPLPPPPVHILDVALPAVSTTNDKVRMFFEFAPEFATDRRFRFFRNAGMFLNILSVLLATILLSQTYSLFEALLFAIICLIYLTIMFSLCIRAVTTVLALCFGALVALYWGIFGGIIGGYFASLANSDALLPFLFSGLIFFVSSVGLHVWYVLHKNS